MADNLDKGAREVADMLKNGDTEGFKKRLADDAQHMSREDFNSFMDKVKTENANDLKVNKNLPEVEFKTASMEGCKAVTEVNVTTPGAVFGNWWRNSETVLSSHGNGMLAVAEGAIRGRQAQLEEAMAMNDNRAKPIEQQR